VSNAFAGLGFPVENAEAVFPHHLLVEGDLSPFREDIDKIIDGLTKWEPKVKEKTLVPASRLTIEGKDYQEAIAKMNNLFLKNMWGDGLPLLPATQERVDWILKGTDLSPDAAIGAILPAGRVATAETLAVTLAMTGGRPEYLPVLIAAIQAILEPDQAHQRMQATTCSVYPAVMVNGPIAKQIRLNAGYSCIGPNPTWPAGGSIGRAVQLLLLTVGAAVPGSGSMAIHGAPAKYAGVVFAEDEENLPEGWKPLNVEYFGYPEGANTVGVLSVASNVDLHNTTIREGDELAKLYLYSDFLRVPNWNAITGPYADAPPGIVVFPQGQAKALVNGGWTKEKIKVFLWENSMIPLDIIERANNQTWAEIVGDGSKYPWLVDASVGNSLPITKKPEDIMIVVAGGEQSGHGYWMHVGCCPAKATSAEIELPADWEQLLTEAEEDLGPAPTY